MTGGVPYISRPLVWVVETRVRSGLGTLPPLVDDPSGVETSVNEGSRGVRVREDEDTLRS